MLGDWYYCCCVGATPLSARTSLAIFATLAVETDEQLLRAAYEELSRCDAWTQVYAFPHVLAAMARVAPAGQDYRLVQDYFDHLVDCAPDHRREQLSRLLDDLGPDACLSGPAGLTAATLSCLEGEARPVSPVPYLDLTALVFETVVAALIVAQVEHPARRHGALHDHLQRDDSPLRRFCQEALDEGSYGRLAARLAARVAAGAMGVSASQIIAGLSRSGIPAFEPDLLDAIAEVQSRVWARECPLQEVVSRLLAESSEQRMLRMIFESRRVERREVAELRQRLALPHIDGNKDLPSLLWQLCLWARAARLDAPQAARYFATCWHPPGDRKLERINPWLPRHKRGSGYADDLMLNLLGSGLVAAELVRKNTQHQVQMLLFLAHVSDVLEEFYRTWLNSHTKPTDTKSNPGLMEPNRFDREAVQLPSRMTGLALCVRTVADRIGQGRIVEVDPAHFMALLEAAHDDQCTLPPDMVDFVRAHLPRVLLRWVADAYQGAVAGTQPARWLAHVERLLEFYSSIRNVDRDRRRKLEAACLQRFLCPGSMIPSDEEQDWRRAQKAGVALHWNVNPRQLLVTERHLPASDWVRADWDAPDGLQVVIARGLERFAAYSHMEEGERRLYESWRNEWAVPLHHVERDLDRFIRLRLLETLDNPLLSEEQGLVIAQTIFEVGSVYELGILFAKVFPGDGTDKYRYLHRPVVQMAARVLERLESGTSTARLRGANALEQVVLLRSRADMLREMLAVVAIQPGEGPRLVVDELRAIVRQRALTRYQVTHAAIDVDDAVVDVGAESPPACLQRALVVDVNESTATVFSDRTAIPGGVFNGLDATSDEWNAFTAAEPDARAALALVVAKEVSRDSHETHCVFNWGGPGYLRMARRSEDVRDLQVGSCVQIGVIRDDSGAWVLDQGAGLRSLPRASSPGDIQQVRPEALRLRPADDPVWNPDTSNIFGATTAHAPDMLGKVLDDRQLAPVDRSLPELIAQLPLKEGGRTGVVALAGVVDEGHLAGWRVATGMGEHYLLDRTSFMPGAASRIDAELENLENGRGLLIAIRASLVDGRVRLDLADTIDDLELHKKYPDLACPFDRRNLLWRRAFERGETITARRDGGRWVAEVRPGVPSFPSMIELEVAGPRPRGAAAHLQCTVKSWEPERACLRAEAVSAYQVNPSHGGWRGFLERWLEPQAGHRFTLARLVAAQRDGYALCSTSENILVFVEAESISMQPLSDSFFSMESREAEILESRPEALVAGGAQELEIIDVPPRVLQPPSCRGILTRLPRDRNVDDAVCQIVWDEDSPQPVDVTIRNLSEFRVPVQQGAVVNGSYDAGRWRFFVNRRRILARALWVVADEPEGGFASASCLATATAGESTRVLAEVGHGLLARLPVDGQAAIRHLAHRKGSTWQGGIARGLRAKALVSRESFGPSSNRYLRVVLDQDGDRLPARCRLGNAYGDVEIVNVHVHVEERPDSMLALRREVETRRIRESDVGVRPRPAGRDPAVLWDSYLARENRQLVVVVEDVDGDLFVRLPVIEAEADGQTLRGILQVPLATGGGWSSRVPVAADEGPFIRHGRYDDEGAAVLVELPSGAWAASFRAAPGTTADLRRAMGAPLDEVCNVGDRKLFYVGVDESRVDERHHLFEFGYGHVISAPEGKLRWHGLPFKAAELLLYSGDQVTDVRFMNDRDLPGAEAETSAEPVMSIAGILVCEGHTLYEQRRDLSLVHLLKIVCTNKEIRVCAIEGFEDRQISQDIRTFAAVSATLTPDSAAQLAPFLPDAQPVSIYGRLEEDEYRRTGGRKLLFEHVRLSFDAGEAGAPLKSGERVFLQAGKIVQLPRQNEIGLNVKPPDGLSPRDVDSVFAAGTGVLVLHRQFSVREELLRRIFEDPELGADTLAGHLVLARITQDSQGRVRMSLKEFPATRRPDALLAAIRARPMLAAVASEPGSPDFIVEVRPAVFVSIPPDRLDGDSANLEPGSIVRIELRRRAGSIDFSLTLASFGDGRYVPDTGRPATALPIGPTLKRRGMTGQAIGDLPGIVAAWTDTEASLAELMQTPHPKLVTLRRGSQRFFVTPGVDVGCGKLELSDGGRKIRHVPLPGSSSREPQPLSWHLLSYADVSIVELCRRIDEGEWRYHDRFSGCWLPDGGLREQPLPDRQTGWTGPVFFEDSPLGLRLRFTPGQFRRFGLPVDTLGDVLRRHKNGTATFPVAGAASDNRGVWVELAPGRLVEVPGLLVEESRTRQSLGPFDWSASAPGDRMTFRLQRGEAYAVDTFALIDWRPGPRSAFGRKTAFLPIVEVDESNGRVRVGAGAWSLDLPLSDIGESATLVAVRADNACRVLSAAAAEASRPEHGDVVMLTLGAGDQPRIAGWPEITPILDGALTEDKVDSITRELTMRAGGRLVLGGQGYARLVRELGGAIPLMVTGRSADGRLVYVSTVLLVADRPPPGRVVTGRAVAMLADGTGVLRIGGRLATVAVDSIVSGVPLDAAARAWEALRTRGVNIWLRRDAEQRVHGGMTPDTRAGLKVSGVASVVDERPAGSAVIVRSDDSLALYWLPLSLAAWVDIPVDRAEALLVKAPLADVAIQQMPGRSPGVSVVDHDHARRQLRGLSVGDELAVQVVEEITAATEKDVRKVIVQSFTTRILMELEVEGPQLKIGHVIPVEITRIRKGPRPFVSVVPIGQRRIRLDLPSWMHAVEGGRLDVSHAQCLEWITEDYPRDLTQTGYPGEDAPLHRLVCHAFRGNGPYRNRMQPRYEVAKQLVLGYRNAPEIALPFALMALLTLERIARLPARAEGGPSLETRAEIRGLVRDLLLELGRRARRSAHVEVLSDLWLARRPFEGETDGLWGRLTRLKLLLHGPQSSQNIRALRRYSEAADMYGSRDQRAVGDAISASLGELDRFWFVREEARACSALVEIARTVSPRAAGTEVLHESQYRRLEILMERVVARPTDVTLLRGFRSRRRIAATDPEPPKRSGS